MFEVLDRLLETSVEENTQPELELYEVVFTQADLSHDVFYETGIAKNIKKVIDFVVQFVYKMTKEIKSFFSKIINDGVISALEKKLIPMKKYVEENPNAVCKVTKLKTRTSYNENLATVMEGSSLETIGPSLNELVSQVFFKKYIFRKKDPIAQVLSKFVFTTIDGVEVTYKELDIEQMIKFLKSREKMENTLFNLKVTAEVAEATMNSNPTNGNRDMNEYLTAMVRLCSDRLNAYFKMSVPALSILRSINKAI